MTVTLGADRPVKTILELLCQNGLIKTEFEAFTCPWIVTSNIA